VRRRAFSIHVTVIGAASLAVALGGLGACGGEDPRDPDRFCERIALVQPALTDGSDPAALVALFQDLDDEVPLQIKDQWHRLASLVNATANYNPNDPAAVQAVLARLLASQSDVNDVGRYVLETCNVTLGPIATTVPFPPVTETTSLTTLPGQSTDVTDVPEDPTADSGT
jgi:hypothetical protein